MAIKKNSKGKDDGQNRKTISLKNSAQTLNAFSEQAIWENVNYIFSYISHPTNIWHRSNKRQLKYKKSKTT